MIPHPRTLRKARMQVEQMVIDGLSAKRTRRYLHHFLLWWVKTIEPWTYQGLANGFIEASWDIKPAAFAAGLIQRYLTKSELQRLLSAYIVA